MIAVPARTTGDCTLIDVKAVPAKTPSYRGSRQTGMGFAPPALFCGESEMMSIAYFAGTALFFAMSLGLVRLFDNLQERVQ